MYKKRGRQSRDCHPRVLVCGQWPTPERGTTVLHKIIVNLKRDKLHVLYLQRELKLPVDHYVGFVAAAIGHHLGFIHQTSFAFPLSR